MYYSLQWGQKNSDTKAIVTRITWVVCREWYQYIESGRGGGLQ